ncbi:Utp21 specific WD40 associated putative domain-containing protein [Scheffersomyces amazonensis]|uniref:Utp21 specific WD40 associated putative domain-containing protein n=1 Tax=Scheffersomyces amazonensis TaxID=1078765 RepID=UPI00315DE2DD
MVEPTDKRRKVEIQTTPKTKKASRIFSPFRVLGNVSNEIPFAIGTLGSTFYVVTSVGRSFQIYDVATLHLLFVSQNQTSSKITALAAHYHYVFASYSNQIGIYKRGRLEHSLECPTTSSINKLLVFGDYLVAVSAKGETFIFKKPTTKSAELYSTLKFSLNEDVTGLIHPPTYLNKIVLTTTTDLYIINIRTGKLLFKTNFSETISCIESAPVLDIVAIGTSTGNIHLYNLRKAKVISKFGVGNENKVVSVSFRTDGSNHLVAGLNSGDLFFYDLNKKSRIHVLRNAHKESYGGIANAKFLNGQPIVITNGGDNHLKEFVFDPNLSATIAAPPRHLRSRGGHSSPPTAIEFPNENKSHFIYSASRDKSFWTFSLRKDAQAQEFSQRVKSKQSVRDKFPEIVAISSSQAREGDWENIITAHKDETFARTWDSRSKRIGRHNLNTIDNGIVKAICISQCGNFALVGSTVGGIGVFNLQSGKLRKRYVLHKKGVTGLAIDGMNRMMVSTGLDGIVGFYNFTESKYLGKLQLEAPITSMVYHKSSDLIACALDDLSIVIIDVLTQKVVRILYGHTNRIIGMDFSPNGRWIVSVSLDSTLRTWDLPTGGCIDGIRLPSVATNVKFSPIGDFLATTHVSGNGISLWTNRSQFVPVSTRHIEEEEFSTTLLPNVSGDGGSTLLEGALDNDNEEVDVIQKYESVKQIDSNLVTLSLGPRSKYSTLIHLDTIKQRSKPKEAPKKPEQAPFFLSLGGEVVGDTASGSNGNEKNQNSNGQSSEDTSKLRALKDNGHSFESKFTTLLREGAEAEVKDYTFFLQYILAAPPSVIDLEIRSLNAFPPLTEFTHFVEALTAGINSHTNYDLFQSLFSMFLKNHGDVIRNFKDESELSEALDLWYKSNDPSHVDELVKYCSGVIGFVTTV